MSYDLYLLRVPPGKDPLTEARVAVNQDGEEINPGLPDPKKEARKRALARALQLIDPELEVFEFDYAQIATTLKISEPEARRKYRHIELNGADGENGIQIELYDDMASITIAYWHHGHKARQVWQGAWRYLQCLQSGGELSIYDPQLERMLDLDKDLEDVLKMYRYVVDATEKVALEMSDSTRPWWKFW